MMMMAPDDTRSAAPRHDPATGTGGSARIILVSHRLPVTVRPGADGPTLAASDGGLATGLRAVQSQATAIWIGCIGETKLPGRDWPAVERQLEAMHAYAVRLEPADARAFYRDVSNGIIWPLFHDRLDRLPLRMDGWDAYERVNERFADVVAKHWRPGDVIWVHDYHLMRLPALLRQRIPEARIGFFLHVPFPNPELFLVLPTRRRLVEGLLGADVVGFHTRRYRGHFTAAVRRTLGLEMDADEHVRYEGRPVRLGIFPIGVDNEALNRVASERSVLFRALEHRPGRERLVIGIDRLDYSKGIPRRLAAIERLLEEHPEWHRHVRFLQLAVPTRGSIGAYRSFRHEVEGLVSRINGRFATPTWSPIHYMHQRVELEDLVSLYRAADVMLVTPVRDGMNLVAKEFVASRSDENGVLVLSEFAGAADELNEAMIVNPYDVAGVASAVHDALLMDNAERRRRMRALREVVAAHDIRWWTREFLDALAAVPAR